MEMTNNSDDYISLSKDAAAFVVSPPSDDDDEDRIDASLPNKNEEECSKSLGTSSSMGILFPGTITMTEDRHQEATVHRELEEELLVQLQREQDLTQRAALVVATTQCSQSLVQTRLERIYQEMTMMEEDDDDSDSDSDSSDDSSCSSSCDSWSDHNSSSICSSRLMMEEEEELEDLMVLPLSPAAQRYHQHHGHNEPHEQHKEEDSSIADPEESLDEEIRRSIMGVVVLPSQTPRSLGVGGLSLMEEMEDCIVEWDAAFYKLNQQHEKQLQACQADIQTLSMRLQHQEEVAAEDSSPATSTTIQAARERLAQLLRTVEAFPSQERLEALQEALEASRQAEHQAQEALAQAQQALEEARQREAQLWAQLAAIPLKNRRPMLPKVKLLHYTKRKLQRLFQLVDRRSTTTKGRPTRRKTTTTTTTTSQEDQATTSVVAPPPREGVSLVLQTSSIQQTLQQEEEPVTTPPPTSMEEIVADENPQHEPLVLFPPDDEEEEEWTCCRHHHHDDDVNSSASTTMDQSPSKSSQHSDCWSDTMIHSISSSSSSPPAAPLAKKACDNDCDVEDTTTTSTPSVSLWHKTKTLLWMQ